MYQLLLCWRYLRTRYIALASVISVTLGVATMIVVNAVMAGFSHEMQKRIHGILSDVVVESLSLNGFPDPDARMAEIDRIAGDYIECMTPTISLPSMLSYRYGGQWITRPVTVVGLPEDAPLAGDFAEYLQHPENRKSPSFQLREGGYDVLDPQGGPESPPREQLKNAGWPHRRWKTLRERAWAPVDEGGPRQGFTPPQPLPDEMRELRSPEKQEKKAFGPAPPPWMREEAPPVANVPGPEATEPRPETAESFAPPGDLPPDFPPPNVASPFAGREPEEELFDPMKQQETGAVLGFALASFRTPEGKPHFTVLPGDDIKLTMPTAGTPPRAVDDSFTVVDLYESKMHEYDSSFVFVPLQRIQKLRGMIDPATGVGNVTAIQIRLKDPQDGPIVRELLRNASEFPPGVFHVATWRDKQGPLLAAVQMETAILNVLLFMIIAVAGFGILAIFFMIVVEKTRDIGIMKSLGASSSGVMGIFLGYGLGLGCVGSGVGMTLGLLFVKYINEIADGLAYCTGQEVFDPSIYYFYEIPAIVDPFTVSWIVAGAVAIAVLASISPAIRAARLHPVEALRYE